MFPSYLIISFFVSIWIKSKNKSKEMQILQDQKNMMNTTLWNPMWTYASERAQMLGGYIWHRNASEHREETSLFWGLSSYDETAPGPSSPDYWSQVFPADAAVATVSKDNTFSWICTGRVNASTAYVQQNPGGGSYVVRHYPGPHKIWSELKNHSS